MMGMIVTRTDRYTPRNYWQDYGLGYPAGELIFRITGIIHAYFSGPVHCKLGKLSDERIPYKEWACMLMRTQNIDLHRWTI